MLATNFFIHYLRSISLYNMIEVIKDIKSRRPSTIGSVVAIGNFDGVHVGHQSIIKIIRRQAITKKVKSGVLVFEPHPRDFFKKQGQNFKLMTPDLRRHKLSTLGLDFVIELPFDDNIAKMSPKQFVEIILEKSFNINHVIIGEDFRFGKNREGDANVLKELCKSLGITVEIVKIKRIENENISSTNIRNLLKSGKIEAANNLLGSSHLIRGIVEKGDQRGRNLNFPTANIKFGDLIIPRFGVYASRVKILGDPRGNLYDGATSIGTRPTFGDNKPNLEVYIFDFNRDIYGMEIDVELNHFIRPELSFNDTDTLVEQMKKDCLEAKTLLSNFKG